MKNIFTILCMLSLITAGDERIVLSIGGSNQKVHDIYFKFEEEGDGLIEIRYQIQIRYQNFLIRPLAFLGSNSDIRGSNEIFDGSSTTFAI